jgi:hypothetical protein
VSDSLREAIRNLLLEAVGVSEQTTTAIASFVSGELLYDKLDIASMQDELRPFIRRFNKLYRVWQRHDASVPEAELEAEAKARSVMSATQDPSTIPEMLDMFGVDDGEYAVTMFDAEGFDPYEVLQAGLKSNPNMRGAGFVRAVLKQYAYQKEIIVLRVVGRVRKIS